MIHNTLDGKKINRHQHKLYLHLTCRAFLVSGDFFGPLAFLCGIYKIFIVGCTKQIYLRDGNQIQPSKNCKIRQTLTFAYIKVWWRYIHINFMLIISIVIRHFGVFSKRVIQISLHSSHIIYGVSPINLFLFHPITISQDV